MKSPVHTQDKSERGEKRKEEALCCCETQQLWGTQPHSHFLKQELWVGASTLTVSAFLLGLPLFKGQEGPDLLPRVFGGLSGSQSPQSLLPRPDHIPDSDSGVTAFFPSPWNPVSLFKYYCTSSSALLFPGSGGQNVITGHLCCPLHP